MVHLHGYKWFFQSWSDCPCYSLIVGGRVGCSENFGQRTGNLQGYIALYLSLNKFLWMFQIHHRQSNFLGHYLASQNIWISSAIVTLCQFVDSISRISVDLYSHLHQHQEIFVDCSCVWGPTNLHLPKRVSSLNSRLTSLWRPAEIGSTGSIRCT